MKVKDRFKEWCLAVRSTEGGDRNWYYIYHQNALKIFNQRKLEDGKSVLDICQPNFYKDSTV